MYYIVARGVKTAKFVNSMLALVKILMLVFIITIFIIFFKTGLFMSDVWGTLSSVGSPGEQIKNTMMVTLFCFFGVEGAIMMSARAKKAVMSAKPDSQDSQ